MSDIRLFDSFLKNEFTVFNVVKVLEDDPNLVTNRWIDYLYDTWKMGIIDLSTYKRLIRTDFSNHIWENYINPEWREKLNKVEFTFSVSPNKYFDYCRSNGIKPTQEEFNDYVGNIINRSFGYEVTFK